MSNTYEIDTEVEFGATFTVEGTGVPIDPTTVVLFVKSPDGVTSTYTGLTRTGVGVYAFDLTLDQSGTYVYKWQGKGSVEVTSPDTYLRVNKTVMVGITP